MLNVRHISASQWTRLLLAALAISVFALAISAFLGAILDAGGDAVGHRTYSAFCVVLTSFVAVECAAISVIVAIRLEFGSSKGFGASQSGLRAGQAAARERAG